MTEIRQTLRSSLCPDEAATVRDLIVLAALSGQDRADIAARGADLVRRTRGADDTGMMELFLAEYGLSTREGVALMCLAEALLRVPDAETIDDLIADKIAPHDWGAHIGDSGSVMVNASTWALMLTGRVLEEETVGVVGALRGVVRRLGEPVIRSAVARAMREMGDQFVLGQTIQAALKRGRGDVEKGYTHSFDMLGEAARTEEDALRYHRSYADAIAAIAKAAKEDIRTNPGISVKLSALHPRYEVAQAEAMLPVLSARLLDLCRAAAAARIGLNIDAEEADRLDLSLDVIEAVLADPSLAGWEGFGVVVQAYGPRARHAIDWLHALAQRLDRRIMVRLVKGAYWDTEVKRAQVLGLPGYPVFTRKEHTDVSYIACARKLLSMTDRIYPQFATHNAHTIAAILHMAGPGRDHFEFQRLHGMGEVLHGIVHRAEHTRCRIYAPVGAHRDLLAYLVRRLLENGANSSFVHQIVDEAVPAEVISSDPLAAAESWGCTPNPRIPAPAALYGPERVNSAGLDLADPLTLAAIEAGRAPFAAPHRWDAGTGREVANPAVPGDVVGTVAETAPEAVAEAITRAAAAAPGWAATPVAQRGAVLQAVADAFEANMPELLALLAREAGKTLADGIAEIREAVDFLRYYANGAAAAEAGTRPRGVIACISPWNFPLAIFTGQIAAALATGNTVVAKPAEQTPLIAFRAVALMRGAGLPEDVLTLVQGAAGVGAALTSDPRLGGVCFTGSTEVARIIDRQLAKTAPEALFIAETGGLNAMIVDSTALPEQAVRDIVASAFQSAGQRCSALRVLYVQREVLPAITGMLKGAMDALSLGDPWALATDVGPVIDAEARQGIDAWVARMEAEGRLIHALPVPAQGCFTRPALVRVEGIGTLEREIFGPVLHIAPFAADRMDAVVAEVNASGYGLTMGLHTRIDGRVQDVVDAAHVGNLYVNRNQIGAVVGVQPFGGEGLSGTGPKAGGPNYLDAFRISTRATAAEAVPEGQPRVDVTAAAADLSAKPWADAIPKLRAALRGRGAAALAAVAALDCGPIDLPGPTGESNQLHLAPRGRVLALGPDAGSLLAQVVMALGTGNSVLAIAPGARAALAPLLSAGAPLVVADGLPDTDTLTAAGIDVVALRHGSTEYPALRRALAAGEGALVPLVGGLDRPAAYCVERTLSIDTTASGGNAELMAHAG
ncbi:bifunctional proline dehydrogenase/L-glutamate gamma-semialdehyde dehydrogenase PutA [Paroceanicella profunda]|uniref:Bifunctional protein PutA n=1 Tax=Paroceanicella profunda TaxID=2579971 RepID=A0A5B8FGL6_9RHOB|nr:bifunctional proline dehydrogenase/L-glutamate gamma-semialdehyde dehydrogenase PutA [Paroceanicella profunda]QDL91028.1 bifunctional proline dehydrogenase/L-glutamate gamma-semialdehyde dehydrogenase PutA [Paroceanicella profunda]